MRVVIGALFLIFFVIGLVVSSVGGVGRLLFNSGCRERCFVRKYLQEWVVKGEMIAGSVA